MKDSKPEGHIATKNTQSALDGFVARTTGHSYHHGESMAKHKAAPRDEDSGRMGWASQRGE